ncbi:Ribosomal protein S18 acetylase RimI [Rubritalea squalenifaciens DSM 18772]|uniref:Ribosomal protein S18 acetylase RimI n=1 Tax=Rubritalea squalenifaciens DSM 18772 TaxID=1123071 RepID=A0A1M6BXU4_9BACT|nr:GNAT family N-acetyltransferase [Rubritalea squalenifaciens]SHI53615.1 Ribosomal protein S18 acetylase RimI [Rubritalea squalenifaciens DSM 18772]
MSTVIVRRIRDDEGALYREMRLAALKDSPQAFASTYEDALQRSDAWWQEQTRAAAAGPDRAIFLALDADPVGMAALYRDLDQPRQGELFQMWVAPERRGSGCARELLECALRWAEENGMTQVRAEVKQGNERVLAFYLANGFVHAGHAGADTVLMCGPCGA